MEIASDMIRKKARGRGLKLKAGRSSKQTQVKGRLEKFAGPEFIQKVPDIQNFDSIRSSA